MPPTPINCGILTDIAAVANHRSRAGIRRTGQVQVRTNDCAGRAANVVECGTLRLKAIEIIPVTLEPRVGVGIDPLSPPCPFCIPIRVIQDSLGPVLREPKRRPLSLRNGAPMRAKASRAAEATCGSPIAAAARSISPASAQPAAKESAVASTSARVAGALTGSGSGDGSGGANRSRAAPLWGDPR